MEAAAACAGHRPMVLMLALAACFVAPALAQPSGAQAVHGTATLTQLGGTLTVTTQNGAGTAHSAINWQSFSVPAGTTTHFAQPSAGSTAINRVLGADPSAIFGTLSSNGRLVLVNPAGIAVGAGAVVDTAGFTASTLRMSEADALTGRLRFGDGNAGGALRVDGQVLARSGDVVLIGSDVQAGAGAVIQSPQGATVLAAGQKVEVTGRGLEGIHFELQAASDQALNLGTLSGDAVGVFAGSLRHSGAIRADAVSAEGGKVILKATGGDALVDGRIVAAGAAGRGGSIDVLGERVGLLAGAALDASGAAGGGQVRIGGDYQGLNAEVPNAKRVYLDAQATIAADATGQGDGGRVIVWSDEMTRMQGRISARGGAEGGDGGFAEVSGKQSLEFTGSVDLRAPQGSTGTLLLDPNDIRITLTGSTTTTQQKTPGLEGVFSGGLSLATISELDLEAQLALSSVIVATNGGSGGAGTITVDSGVDVQWSTANALGLQADGDIVLDGNLTGTNASSVLSLQTLNGSITQAATSVVRVGGLQINANSAANSLHAVRMQGANQVGILAARSTGLNNKDIFFNNAQALTIGSVSSPYGAARTGVDTIGTSGPGAISITTAGALAVNANVVGGAVALEGTSIGLGLGAQVSSIGTLGLQLRASGGGTHDLGAGSLASDSSVQVSGVGDFILGNVKASFVSLVEDSPATVPATFAQRAGTVIEAASLYARANGLAGGTINLSNAGNKIASFSANASGDVTVTSSVAMDLGYIEGVNVALKAADLRGAAESGILAGGGVSLSGTSAASTIDMRNAYIYGGGNVALSGAGNATLGTVDAVTMTANLSGSLVQDTRTSFAYLSLAGGLTATVGGDIDLRGATTSPNTIGYVEGSAGGNVSISGVKGVGASGLSAKGNLNLVADSGILSEPAAFSGPLLAVVSPGLGDLDLVGNVSAGGAVSLASTTGVIVQDTSTVTGSGIEFLAPLTRVYGTLLPGGAGSIGSVSASGELIVGSTGKVQLDVASLSSFDTLSVAGAARTDAGAILQLVDLSGGKTAGSFSPVTTGAGSSLAFALPAFWSVNEAAPYVITAGLAAVPAPAPTPVPAPPAVAPSPAPQPEVNGQVLVFSEQFAEQTDPQDEDDREPGQDDIVLTDAACKPA